MAAPEADACLRRIGAERPAAPTGAALRELHGANPDRHRRRRSARRTGADLGRGVLSVYRERFGIRLDSVPAVRDPGVNG